MRYELQIALRYLRARRRDVFISITTLFTAIGVMIGVAALVMVLAVMSGFEQSLRQRILTLTPQVEVLGFGGSIVGYPEMEARIDALPSVAGSDPFVIGQAMMSSTRGLSGVLVRGIDPKNAAIATQLLQYIQQGSVGSLAAGPTTPLETSALKGNPPDEAGPPTARPSISDGAIAIGVTLADKLKVHVGDSLSVVAPISMGPNAELATKTGHFIVGAIFASGVAFLDKNLAFMGLPNAQSFFGRQGKVDGVEVRLKNLDQTDAVTGQIRAMLGSDYQVTNWEQFNAAAAAGFEMLKEVYAVVLLLLIAVAAFNLVATLIMVVMEKRKDIAVLMAMGATPGDIRRIFVLKGLIVGAIGTAAGLGIGGLGCFILAHYHFIHIQREIYGMSSLPIDVQPLSFVLVAVASLILCLLATFYPARQAANALPVEVFRA
ncbi:MAG TPA: FtsX-like permease family protein [Candidatus Binataceae bacterium]|nr:FtsX-like permease family protein [Candidatus Binataceae bacterium]